MWRSLCSEVWEKIFSYIFFYLYFSLTRHDIFAIDARHPAPRCVQLHDGDLAGAGDVLHQPGYGSSTLGTSGGVASGQG